MYLIIYGLCVQKIMSCDSQLMSVCVCLCVYMFAKHLNAVLGKGPFKLIPLRERNLILAVNRTSGLVFMKRGLDGDERMLTTFMMTPGLSKTRPHGKIQTSSGHWGSS